MYSFNKVAGICTCVVLAGFAGCMNGMGNMGPEVISGTATLSSFPDSPTLVRALSDGAVVAEGPIAEGGEFSLTVPAGRNTLELVAPTATYALVFPRATGAIDVSFVVRGSIAPFDLGAVEYVGDPTAQTYAFDVANNTAGTALTVGTDPVVPTAPDGSVPVDDSATSTVCRGGHHGGRGHGAHGDFGVQTTPDVVPSVAAVATHNVPASIGCGC